MKPASLERLVIIRPDRIGDVVISSSCLAPVRASLPQATLCWMIPRSMQSLFARCTTVDRVVTTGQGGAWARAWHIRRELRTASATAVALLQPDRAAQLGAFLAGIPIRVGWRQFCQAPQFLTNSLQYAKSAGLKHEAAYNFDVLGLLGLREPADYVPELTPEYEARASLLTRFETDKVVPERCMALHLAAHGNKLRAPLATFAELAGALHRAHGLRPLLVGMDGNPPAAEFARAAGLNAAEVLDWRGKTSLAESAWLFARVALTVTRDSGPAHLAAAMDGRVLTLFVDMRPIMGPIRWRPCGRRVAVVESRAGAFMAEEVRTAAEALLRLK